MGALAGLNQLERGANGIGGGVGSAAEQRIGIAHLDQHGAEVVALLEVGAAVLGGHLALAELDHLLDHRFHVGVGGGVDDLKTLNVKPALSGLGLNDLNLTDQDRGQESALLQLCSGFQDTGVVALGEDDLPGIGAELGFQNIEHNSFPPRVFVFFRPPDGRPLLLHYYIRFGEACQ